MALYCGYFDESGTHDSKFIVVAGLIGTVRDWQWFEDEWKNVLSSEGVTGPFHMQHLEKCRKQFRGWDKARRERLLGALLPIIRKRAWLAVASAVSMEDYNAVVTGRVKNHVGSAYTLAANGALWCVGKWAARTGRFDDISYVFDGGHRNLNEFLQTYTKTRADEEDRTEYRLGVLSLDTDDHAAPLQAADMIAYETWKYLINRSDPARSLRYTFEEILKLPYESRFFGRRPLEEMRTEFLQSKGNLNRA